MKIIDLHDRFARIFVAGLSATLAEFILNLFSYHVLHFSHRRYINWSAILIFGNKATNITEIIISTISQIGFTTSLIIILAPIVLKENCKNYILKGFFIGLSSWFVIMSLSYIIGIEKILPIDAPSAISFMLTSSIWGISAALILKYLDDRYGIQYEAQTDKRSFNETSRGNFSFTPTPAKKIDLDRQEHREKDYE